MAPKIHGELHWLTALHLKAWLVQIATKRGEFDHIIIETTGLADPRPIISIFTTTHIGQHIRLDGVVTMVDVKNVERHLNDKEGTAKGAVNEALQQIAYADRIVLNKTDLVSHHLVVWAIM